MSNRAARTTRKLSCLVRIFLVSVLCVLCFNSTPNLKAKTPARPKILGIARVKIEGGSTPTDDADKAIRFYPALGLGTMGSFQSGATVYLMYGLNEHQELLIQAGPRLNPPPGTPPRSKVSLVLFETDDAASLHDYLRSQKFVVSDLISEPFRLRDAEGKSLPEEALLFTLLDPDSHPIGFIQYKSPLKFRKEERQVSSRLIHAGFIVHDRPTMEHFYKDILGFRPYWRGGRTDDHDDWASLQVPDGSDWVEFMLNVPDNADKRTLGVANHIALGVTDIQAAKAQLIKNGVTLTEEPKIGRGGKWQLNVYDPDGTRIEFMEFTPVQKPCCSEYTAPPPKP